MSPHNCNKMGPYSCSGAECSVDGVCAQKGCTYNPSILGNHNYYGPGLQVDTSRPVTVVTQFPTDASGTLQSIKRLYIQDGKIIQDASLNFTGTAKGQSISDAYCTGREGRFMELGGVEGMGRALERGMVLALSVWWGGASNMTWLDSGSAGVSLCLHLKILPLLDFVGSVGIFSTAGVTSFRDNIINHNANKTIAL